MNSSCSSATPPSTKKRKQPESDVKRETKQGQSIRRQKKFLANLDENEKSFSQIQQILTANEFCYDILKHTFSATNNRDNFVTELGLLIPQRKTLNQGLKLSFTYTQTASNQSRFLLFLFSMIKNGKNISIVKISNQKLIPELIGSFLEGIQNCTALTKLDLVFPNFYIDVWIALFDHISILKDQLTSLVLNDFGTACLKVSTSPNGSLLRKKAKTMKKSISEYIKIRFDRATFFENNMCLRHFKIHCPIFRQYQYPVNCSEDNDYRMIMINSIFRKLGNGSVISDFDIVCDDHHTGSFEQDHMFIKSVNHVLNNNCLEHLRIVHLKFDDKKDDLVTFWKSVAQNTSLVSIEIQETSYNEEKCDLECEDFFSSFFSNKKNLSGVKLTINNNNYKLLVDMISSLFQKESLRKFSVAYRKNTTDSTDNLIECLLTLLETTNLNDFSFHFPYVGQQNSPFITTPIMQRLQAITDVQPSLYGLCLFYEKFEHYNERHHGINPTRKQIQDNLKRNIFNANQKRKTLFNILWNHVFEFGRKGIKPEFKPFVKR